MAKDEQIIIRTDSDLKKNIQKMADESRRELSDYLRCLIEDAIKNEYDPIKGWNHKSINK